MPAVWFETLAQLAPLSLLSRAVGVGVGLCLWLSRCCSGRKGTSTGSAALSTRQPDVAGGHCNTLQCSVVTAVLAFVAERGASSVSVWADS